MFDILSITLKTQPYILEYLILGSMQEYLQSYPKKYRTFHNNNLQKLSKSNQTRFGNK